MTLLVVENIRAGYGGGDIVKGVNFLVGPGEMVTLIGPNGAGKSTLLKSIAGAARITGGRVLLDGADINALLPAARTHLGAAFMPQDRNIFRTLTVTENLTASSWGAKDVSRRQEEVLGLLPSVKTLLHRRAGGLSGGQRQMVALAMCLMARPRILLVDEPTAGLSPVLVGEMLDVLRSLTASGLGVLIVEQNARAALARADRALVLVDGRIARGGPAASLANEPDFGALFFGEAA